jgi:transposase
VDKSINELIENENAHTIVMQPINNKLVINNKNKLHDIDIRWIYRLNSQLIKYVKSRLEYKLSLKDINLVLVSPACTSKVCYNCGSLNTVITNGYFKCKNCTVGTGRVANILSNILNRHGDKCITQTSSGKEVERLLEQRFVSLSGLT